MIYNKRFKIPTKKISSRMLYEVELFFKKKLKRNESPLRFAIVDVKGKNLIVDATIIEEDKL